MQSGEAGRVPGVILAGGQSRRMGGGDKALADLGGRPVLSHVIARLRGQVGALALNANGDASRFAPFGLVVLPDPVAGYPGPLAGVLAAMDWAGAQGARHVVTVAADTPFFPEDLVARLRASGGDVALAETPGGLHPTFGLWPVGLRDTLAQALAAGSRRVGDWAEAQGARRVAFPEDAAFFNLNTPAELEAARARVSEGSR